MKDFDLIILKEEALQTEAFVRQYQEYLPNNEDPAFNSPLFRDIEGILNSILLKYKGLTDFQKDVLDKLFNAFNSIRVKIDPNRLKPFKHSINVDNELLLFRNTEQGLTNIIISPDECLAYSFIGKGLNTGRVLEFYEIQGDFELLAYHFFSN